jgi:hypothetical protein
VSVEARSPNAMHGDDSDRVMATGDGLVAPGADSDAQADEAAIAAAESAGMPVPASRPLVEPVAPVPSRRGAGLRWSAGRVGVTLAVLTLVGAGIGVLVQRLWRPRQHWRSPPAASPPAHQDGRASTSASSLHAFLTNRASLTR